MPNSIKYSTSAQTLALKKGNFWIGTGDVGKGPTSTTDYYNGITPPAGGYTIYLNKASQGPAIYTAGSDAALISLTNKIAGTSYTTAAESLNYFIGQTDKMSVNRDYESIITDSLIWSVDAGYTNSYPKNGTTWYDMLGSGNGTLTNGPIYDSGDGGTLDFDGSDDEVIFSTNSIYNTSNVTVEAWVNFVSDGSRHIILANWSGYALEVNPGTDVVMYVYNSEGQVGAFTSGGFFSFGSWMCVSGTYDSSAQEIKTYINGVLRATRSNTPNITYSVDNRRISPTSYGGGPVNNKIALVRQYSRALSSTEILQNYNVQKSRFGL